MNRDLLIATLEQEEGNKPLLYDDKTTKLLKAGDTIIGNPTWGIGWNVSGKKLSPERARIMCGWCVDDSWGELQALYPWVVQLSEPRQRAMTDLFFQLGDEKFPKFNIFLSLMEQGQYDQAADDLEGTAWWKQVGQRGPKIQALIRGIQ